MNNKSFSKKKTVKFQPETDESDDEEYESNTPINEEAEDLEEDGTESENEEMIDGSEDEVEEDEDSDQNSEDSGDSEPEETKKTQKTTYKERQADHIDSLKQTINAELNQMTFEEIKKLQNKIGLKKYL